MINENSKLLLIGEYPADIDSMDQLLSPVAGKFGLALVWAVVNQPAE